jgi:hypothetical protein
MSVHGTEKEKGLSKSTIWHGEGGNRKVHSKTLPSLF